MIGHALSWRMTFVGVGIMASIAVAGLFFGIPRGIDRQGVALRRRDPQYGKGHLRSS
jgi:predicted MFS family arabinose efflux permease